MKFGIFSAFLLAIGLAGCASHRDCAESLCGCYKKHAETVTVEFTGPDDSPIANARLFCHDSGAHMGTTNPNGILKLQVQGATSPGCGFFPDCQIAFFKKENEGHDRPFWFARFVRGEDVHETDGSIRLIERKR